uniref:Uncharacterized protein n=1 Tax=Erythrolobus australicus TaxID=1077150 RepID=A0A6T5WA06_9RHOD|mmetsp:Transcript_3322/g.9170  ORF Transcript_3322/g.9170 Transcript_3322/m.9170 type:complete len:104 (+) Transcript_3322:173-484(+)
MHSVRKFCRSIVLALTARIVHRGVLTYARWSGVGGGLRKQLYEFEGMAFARAYRKSVDRMQLAFDTFIVSWTAWYSYSIYQRLYGVGLEPDPPLDISRFFEKS